LVVGLGGGQLDSGDLGVGEDDARDGAAVGACLVAADVGARDPRLVFADVGERQCAGEVADRSHAVGGAAALIDLDATLPGVEPDHLEAEPVEAGRASDGDQQLVAGDLLAAGEPDDLASVHDGGLLGASAEMKLDALCGQRVRDQRADRRILARDQPLDHLDDRHRGAEAAQELAELDADRAAAEHHNAARQFRQRRGLAVGPVGDLVEARIGGTAVSPLVASATRPGLECLVGDLEVVTANSLSRRTLPAICRTSAGPRLQHRGDPARGAPGLLHPRIAAAATATS